MNAIPLLSPRIKLDRAKDHFRQLNSEVQAFIGRNPYHVVVDHDSEPAIQIHRLHIAEPIPVTFSPIIGDLLHNLMGALDSLATKLARDAGATEEELRKTYFPIHWRESELATNERTLSFFERTGADVEKLVRRIQPYSGGRGDFLLRLKNFDIDDKHRSIIPVVSSVAQITFHSFIPNEVPIQAPAIGHDLKEGDELLRTGFWEGHYQAQTQFNFHIGIDHDKPLMAHMGDFIYLVERVINLFDRKFFQP